MNLPITSVFWQISANFLGRNPEGYAAGLIFGTPSTKAGVPTLAPVDVSLYRYPSPSLRPDLTRTRSKKPCAGRQTFAERATCSMSFVTLNKAPIYRVLITLNIGGRKSCNSKVGRYWRRLSRRCRDAWITILNAVRLAPLLVRLSQMSQTETLSLVPSLAARQAFSVTTWAFANKNLLEAPGKAYRVTRELNVIRTLRLGGVFCAASRAVAAPQI